jgi:hypothetical protein
MSCGADGWAMTASGMRGVLNDALSIYFGDPTLASAFVARWRAGYQVETAPGRLPGAGGRACSPSRSNTAPDTVRGCDGPTYCSNAADMRGKTDDANPGLTS